jgi:SAM-dependent methyltransferase
VSAAASPAARVAQGLRRRVGRQALRRHWRRRIVKTRAGTELVRNWRIDRRYGGSCGGAFVSRFADAGAYGTSSLDYWQLHRIFSAENGLEIRAGEKLVDVGCGKGRVLNHWLSLGRSNRIVGIELDPEVAAFARDRLAGHENVEVITGDAVALLPDDASILFFFNPFDATVMRRFRDRVADLYPPGSAVRIVYQFAVHRNVFDEDSRFEVSPIRHEAFQPAVVVRRAP